MNKHNMAYSTESANFPETRATTKFDKAKTLADKALRMAETYHTPPAPKVYEVWYSCAAGENDKLNNYVSSVISSGGNINEYEIEQIHDKFLSDVESGRSKQDAVSQNLDEELGNIVKLVQLHLESSNNFSGSLDNVVSKLSSNIGPSQLKKTLEHLIVENAKMRNETANLTSSLKKSKSEIQKVRVNLKKSQEREMRDPLTNMANRRWFDLCLEREVGRAHKKKTPLCLVMIDIDHFKKLNDTFGHPVGDQVLKYFASVFSMNLKGQDISARYGGEEFSVILPGTTEEDAEILMNKIRTQIAGTNLVVTRGKKPIGQISASFGIALIQENDTPEDLIRNADSNLYRAKKSGRNCVIC